MAEKRQWPELVTWRNGLEARDGVKHFYQTIAVLQCSLVTNRRMTPPTEQALQVSSRCLLAYGKALKVVVGSVSSGILTSMKGNLESAWRQILSKHGGRG